MLCQRPPTAWGSRFACSAVHSKLFRLQRLVNQIKHPRGYTLDRISKRSSLVSLRRSFNLQGMDLPQSNPRRRNSHNPHSAGPTHNHMNISKPSTAFNLSRSLKKSPTFHAPTSLSGDHDPILNIPSLPRRSLTCFENLELLAGDGRIAQIIGAVDRSLSGLGKFASDSQETFVADILPVPLFMLHANVSNSDQVGMDSAHTTTISSQIPRVGSTKRHHASDSGIGSTVSSSEASMSGKYAGVTQGLASNTSNVSAIGSTPCALDEGGIQTGINGLPALALGSTVGSRHALSEYACKQIQKYIILPIVREPKLKEFHSLAHGIPYRVARKEITCLRDLEKVLLWLAPKWSTTKSSFLTFCETSIQCIHTTVEHLNEHDQRRPTDRPYTNGYFLDLVEQVRQYAKMLAASRAMVASEASSTKEQTSDERLELVGGLGKTGQLAELVRTKDGRSVSLRTGIDLSVGQSSQGFQPNVKRCVDEVLDEDVLRSMARRRKSDQPVMKDIQKCRDCSKVFKRPCDLTKHEKTHSRPWKCVDASCKYHEYGWPTEKERDRHMNDKHSITPSMYRCQYPPCPYESKRESNCKQHMEKAHGWAYVRSKNNGRKSKTSSSGKTPPTPQLSTPGSHIFDAPTPETQDGPNSCPPASAYHIPASLAGSAADPEMPGLYGTEMIGFGDTFGPYDPSFSWAVSSNEFGRGNAIEHATNTNRTSWDETMANPSAPLSSFESSLNQQEEQPLFGASFDWSNMDQDLTSLNIQLVTPAMSVDTRPFDVFSRNASMSHDAHASAQIPSLSPGAQGDAMLYSPHSMLSNDLSADEGFVEFNNDLLKPTHDFSLFDSSNPTLSLNSATNEGMFQDLSTFNTYTTWSGRGVDLAHQFGTGDLMHIEE